MSSLMELKDGLMAQASLLPGERANNYMVAILFEGSVGHHRQEPEKP